MKLTRKITLIIVVFAISLSITSLMAQANSDVSCDWNKTCSGSDLVRAANCLINNTGFNFSETIYCSNGCVNLSIDRFGPACSGDASICSEVELPFMAFGSNFVLALGLMLMLVGAGVISDNILRSGERRRKREGLDDD